MSLIDLIKRHEEYLSHTDRVEIMRLVCDYGRDRYLMPTDSGEINIDLDKLRADSPETIEKLATVVRNRLDFLNTPAR